MKKTILAGTLFLMLGTSSLFASSSLKMNQYAIASAGLSSTCMSDLQAGECISTNDFLSEVNENGKTSEFYIRNTPGYTIEATGNENEYILKNKLISGDYVTYESAQHEELENVIDSLREGLVFTKTEDMTFYDIFNTTEGNFKTQSGEDISSFLGKDTFYQTVYYSDSAQLRNYTPDDYENYVWTMRSIYIGDIPFSNYNLTTGELAPGVEADPVPGNETEENNGLTNGSTITPTNGGSLDTGLNGELSYSTFEASDTSNGLAGTLSNGKNITLSKGNKMNIADLNCDNGEKGFLIEVSNPKVSDKVLNYNSCSDSKINFATVTEPVE